MPRPAEPTEAFRFLGDFLMVASRAVLIKKILATRSVSGLSLRTQALYLVAYLCRYLDIFTPVGATLLRRTYNTVMKAIFISYQLALVYLIGAKHRSTYNRRYDDFNILILVGAAFGFGLLLKGATASIGEYFSELLYTASLILEAVAILPQLAMIQEAGECESLTALHILLLSFYRLSYVVHFVLRARVRAVDHVMVGAGLVQTLLYGDFFVVYYRMIKNRLGLSISSVRAK